MRSRPSVCVCWVSACGLAMASCLPKDTRPVPGSVYATVSGDAPLLGSKAPFLTADGWMVSYDRFLLSIGEASLEGDSCASYYNADYRRILDMQIGGAQKLSILYALGPCYFTVRVAGPETDSVLGEGVSDADKTFMGTPGSDAYGTNRGISVFALGRATKGGVTKTFSWAFRDPVSYDGCTPLEGDAATDEFDLRGGAAATFDLHVHGEALFYDTLDPAIAVPRFAPFAAADDEYGNGDGAITLAELGQVPLGDVGAALHADSSDGGTTSSRDAGLDAPMSSDATPSGGSDDVYTETVDGGRVVWKTLEDYVYLGLLRDVVRVGGSERCRRVGVGSFGKGR